jgi:hypothetical protein
MSSNFSDLSKNAQYRKTTLEGLAQAINHQASKREVSRYDLMSLLPQFHRRRNTCDRVENFYLEFQGREIGHKRTTSCKDLVKYSIIRRNSRAGNESMPRSISSEGKQT